LRPQHHPAGVKAEVVSTATPGQYHHSTIPNFTISNTTVVRHQHNSISPPEQHGREAADRGSEVAATVAIPSATGWRRQLSNRGGRRSGVGTVAEWQDPCRGQAASASMPSQPVNQRFYRSQVGHGRAAPTVERDQEVAQSNTSTQGGRDTLAATKSAIGI
jgi:hypothetical protein